MTRAAWAAPFISREMYHDMVLPFHDRQAKFGRDAGIPITMHNCGKAEVFMEDLRGIGVNAWDPAQTCNDLKGVQEKFGNSLVLMGCWDARGHLLAPDVTEEEITAVCAGHHGCVCTRRRFLLVRRLSGCGR